MKLLIDIGHPAHIHYFRNLAGIFQEKGSKVLFTSRDKEVTIQLLDHYGFPYINFERPFISRIGKVWGLFWFTMRFFLVALKFRPDIYLNATPYSTVVAWLLNKPHISLEDTFNFEQVRLYMPFTSVVLTGSYPHPNLGKKEIKYSGYQELAYLHPNRFKPDNKIIKKLGLKNHEKFIIIRFISWGASHDFKSVGISLEQKIALIDEMKMYANVFISSESELPDALKKYQLPTQPYEIHDVLAFASLYIGEGATMASECAMLGTPSIYINPQNVFTIREQEDKFGLVYSFRNFNGVLEKALEIMNNPNIKKPFQINRKKMLAGIIDLTAFLVWFIENYPESKKIMRENPEYQERFK